MDKLNLNQKEIIERIGYFRAKKNISAYKLGMQLGHSKTYFYRVESGQIKLSLEAFLEILDILQITTTEFFCPILNERDLKLVENFKKLSTENQNTIFDLAKKLK